MASQGGHLNPAVTFAFLITKKICLMRAVLYWIAQIVGSILGSACVFAVSCAAHDIMWQYGWEPRQCMFDHVLPADCVETTSNCVDAKSQL